MNIIETESCRRELCATDLEQLATEMIAIAMVHTNKTYAADIENGDSLTQYVLIAP